MAAAILSSSGSVAGTRFASRVSHTPEQHFLPEPLAIARHSPPTIPKKTHRTRCMTRSTQAKASHDSTNKDVQRLEVTVLEANKQTSDEAANNVHLVTENNDEDNDLQAKTMMNGLLGLGAISTFLIADQAHAEEAGSTVAGKTKTMFTDYWNALLENEATVALLEKRAATFIKELDVVKDMTEIKKVFPATEFRLQAVERSLADLKADNVEIKATLQELKVSIDRLGPGLQP